MVTDLKAIRAFNLDLLRHLHGGHKRVAKMLEGVANWKYLSDYATASKPISDYTARAIENRLQLPPHWLDRDNATVLKSFADEFDTFALIVHAPTHIRGAIRTLLKHANASVAA